MGRYVLYAVSSSIEHNFSSKAKSKYPEKPFIQDYVDEQKSAEEIDMELRRELFGQDRLMKSFDDRLPKTII